MCHPHQQPVPIHLWLLSASPPGSARAFSGDTSGFAHPVRCQPFHDPPPCRGSATAPVDHCCKDRPAGETDRAFRSITGQNTPASNVRYFACSDSSSSRRRNNASCGEIEKAAICTSRCASREKTVGIACHSASSVSSPPLCDGFQ